MRTVINTPGDIAPTRFGEVEEPKPEAAEALVAIRAFSVNRGELALLKSRPEGWRPGQDIAGVVVEPAADGSGPSSGSRVVGLVEGAGWSQFAAVPTERLAVLPDSVSMEQAATLPIAGLTALRTLRTGGNLLGRRVLITGANGAVGRFQIELAARSAAQVTAVTTRAEEVRRQLQELGAEEVVPDIEVASGLFDLIQESVGGTALTGAIKKIAPGGTIVVLGSSSGEAGRVSVYDFIGHEGARIQNYMSYASTDPVDRDLQVLADLVGEGRLRPTIGFSDCWSELNTAIELLGDRKLSGGKAVLSIPD
ncbi:zinc-binding dehydrogenase [Actinomadura nitritigenes]|uniref:Zinc-binding dehydrogenase n=1 Tax=Actinomadura nitritigenes TaxID=134602 RepID=A0ABS3RF63_9ACTN|nr:zinc-binding dehydrogenase [Actinomadura nitritigenes]MBO2444873.1 zinc-binding dehydrogenase [Actinomadura nitritigenes]